MRYLFIFLTCLQVHDNVLQFLIFKIRKNNIFFSKFSTNENFWYFFQLLWTLTTKIFFGRPENLWTVIKLYCTCFEVSFYIFNMPTSTRQSFTIFNFQDPKKIIFFFQNFPLPPTNENFWYFVQLLWTLTTKIFFGRPENLWTVIKLYCTCFEVSFYIFNMPTSTRQSFTIFNFQDPKKIIFFFSKFSPSPHKWKFLIFCSAFVNFDDQNIFWKTWKSMNSNGNVLYMLWGIFLYF